MASANSPLAETPHTAVRWAGRATPKRVRDQLVVVTEPTADSLVESDANSSMVTTWTVLPADAGVSTVRVRTPWNGAGGIGGFFERTFAPRVMRRMYAEELAKLDAYAREQAATAAM